MDGWQHSVESRLSGLDNHILDLRSELRETRAELRGDVKDLRSELHGLRSEMLSWFRWLLGLLVVLFGAMLGAMAKGFGWV